jgi:hypothetical protein
MKKIFVLLAMIMLSSCAPTHEQMVQTMRDYHSNRIHLILVKDQEKFQKDCNDCAEFAIRWYEKARSERVMNIISLSAGVLPKSMLNDKPYLGGEDIGESPSKKHADNVFRRCMINKGYEMFWQ